MSNPSASDKPTESGTLAAIGKRFRQLRLARNISQEDLAAGSAVGLSTVKRLESGRGCNLAALVQLLDALGYADALPQLFERLSEQEASGKDDRRRASTLRKPPSD